jgi:PAS domain S-box-containing protein
MANFKDLDDALKQLSPAYDVLGDAAHIVDMSGKVVYANAASNLTYGFQRDEFLGQHISVVIPKSAVQISIEMILAAPNHVWKGQVLRQRKNGESFDAEITVVLMVDESGRPIGRTAIIRDQSELRRMESEVRSFSAQRSTLAEIGNIVNFSLDINDVYSSIAHEIGNLLPYDRFAITIPHEETGEYSKPYGEGTALPSGKKGERFTLPGSFTEYLLDHKESINHTESASGSFPFFEPARKAGLKTMLSVPVISKDRVVAALYLHSFKPNAYSHEDQMLVEQIASQIAGAIVTLSFTISRPARHLNAPC